MKTLKTVLLAVALSVSAIIAQENMGYKMPPQEILELVDVQRAPSMSIDKDGRMMLFMYRGMYLNLSDLNEKEMRLAGLRINPITNIGTSIRYFDNIKIKSFDEKQDTQIEGLPHNPKITNLSWAPDNKYAAFTNTTEKGVELWLINIAAKRATKISEDNLNANLGSPYTWSRDSKSLLVKQLPKERKPLVDKADAIPTGPITQNSLGRASHNRTFQDLLKDKVDEANFESLTSSEIYKIDLSGTATLWAPQAIYSSTTFSPDGNYVMVRTIEPPFSYTVPLYRFPSATVIYDKEGHKINDFDKSPLLEVLPKGFMATQEGKRSISWRADKPATLFWAEALDGGDPANDVPFRDAVYQVGAPFTSTPELITKTVQRYAGITWGSDNMALLYDSWWDTRNKRTYIFNPSDANVEPKILFDRNTQDIYSDPGRPQTVENKYGRQVLKLKGRSIYLIGAGYSEKGKFPFVNLYNTDNGKVVNLYRSKYTDKELSISSVLDYGKGQLLVSLQSPTEYPNYHIVNMKNGKSKPISFLANPFEKIAGVSKEVIKYKRKDGVELSGTLYLPKGYDKDRDGRLPMVMWAYPTEYKDKNSAGQTDASANSFIYPYYGSPIYWVMRGYAVLDDAAFPIIGENDQEPNDTFIEQLVLNAEAAIDAVSNLGYVDRDRVAVGGHSYGAFMTAHLLTHSNLFAAGIARSGAYNRTLTPFGFQREQRNYWEAKDVYDIMSPFMHAEKMKTPMLLIHGSADNNAGTHTMQSERYFAALKGLGAPVRLVLLPNESHSYVAKENILHLLWEQDEWLEKYVKNRKIEVE